MSHQSTLDNAKTPRSRRRRQAYVSPLRAEQAADTRLRILRAFGDEVQRDQDDITVQQVAARAGVSVPTLYRHFPSLDDLGDAYWAWVEPQLGTFARVERPDDLPRFTRQLFEGFAANQPLITAMLASRSGRRLRDRTIEGRNDAFRRAMAPLTRRMPEREARAVTALMKILSSGAVWELMRKDWGLDGVEAGHVVSWAMQVLIDSLRTHPRPLKQEKGPRP